MSSEQTCACLKKLLAPDPGQGFIMEERMSMKYLKIGQLAKEADVNIDTVRYYERRG